ncbi:recombinase family protein [Dehalobacter sp.]|uniref:recombinase family protein n=1 Tax=Dehalobacter sp. TaxID=1962289 RepID=UPI00258BE0C2|nr:recombinase family protein [Dehalobacter sp.]MDJ0304756.1 recombinase family protein [Dehalobacter sp.]
MAHTPYGYLIASGVAVIDGEKAENVKVLFQEYLSGTSLQRIADIAGIPRKHVSLGRMIEDKRYMGDTFYPAIIDKEIWDEAQSERKRRAEHLGRNKNYFALDKTKISPFWGIVFCDDCGSEFRRYADKGNERWKCSRYLVKNRLTCKSAMIKEDLIEAAFMRVLGKIDLDEIAVKPKLDTVAIKQLFSDPFEQAEYVYSISKVDDFDYMTDKLLTAMKDKPTVFDGNFMRRIIKCIKVATDNTATFEFLNSKIMREELKANGS